MDKRRKVSRASLQLSLAKCRRQNNKLQYKLFKLKGFLWGAEQRLKNIDMPHPHAAKVVALTIALLGKVGVSFSKNPVLMAAEVVYFLLFAEQKEFFTILNWQRHIQKNEIPTRYKPGRTLKVMNQRGLVKKTTIPTPGGRMLNKYYLTHEGKKLAAELRFTMTQLSTIGIRPKKKTKCAKQSTSTESIVNSPSNP